MSDVSRVLMVLKQPKEQMEVHLLCTSHYYRRDQCGKKTTVLFWAVRERDLKKKKKISGYENLVLGIYRGVTSFTWKSNLGKFNLWLMIISMSWLITMACKECVPTAKVYFKNFLLWTISSIHPYKEKLHILSTNLQELVTFCQSHFICPPTFIFIHFQGNSRLCHFTLWNCSKHF